MNTPPRAAVECFHSNGMPHRITITVTGIVTLPTPTDEPRETDLIDLISIALAEHFPEFRADPNSPVVAVHVEEVPDQLP